MNTIVIEHNIILFGKFGPANKQHTYNNYYYVGVSCFNIDQYTSNFMAYGIRRLNAVRTSRLRPHAHMSDDGSKLSSNQHRRHMWTAAAG